MSPPHVARAWVLAAALLAAPASVAAQDAGEDVPAFPVGAEAISVDVVVLDRNGRPVVGLTSSDFTLLEDGVAQRITGFQARDPRSSAAPESGARGFAHTSRFASNEDVSRAGRSIALVVDDLGLDPVEHAPEVRRSITRWLERADPRDEVTLVTTSGDLWWSDRVAGGREDLLALASRIEGRRLVHPLDPLNEFEAYTIANYESRGPPPGESAPPGGPAATGITASAPGAQQPEYRAAVYTTERVMERWYRAGYCEERPDDWRPPCRAKVEARAAEVQHEARRRARALLGIVERLSNALAGWRGRKSIFVFSVGLIRDTHEPAYDAALAASRRGNTAISFLDVRGLRGPGLFTAESRSSDLPTPLDGRRIHDEAFALTAGTEYLAEATGGASVRDTNDLVRGLERLVRQSSAYYLLGYQPERAPDGSWRSLEVHVARPGVRVRARAGYFASAADAPTPRARGPVASGPPAQLVAGGARDGIGLRLASYVRGPTESELARVLVALEVDTRDLVLSGSGEERTARVSLDLIGVSRGASHVASLTEDLEVTLRAGSAGRWWGLTRELQLPPGVAQVRALVSDLERGRSGAVVQRLEVPRTDRPFLSTPIVSDQLSVVGTQPQLSPIAHRDFRPPGPLVVAYEVFGLTERSPGAGPEVLARYVLRHLSRGVVRMAPATPIEVGEDGRVARLHSFALGDLAEGPYELELVVEDQVTGRRLTAQEPFLIVREQPPAARAR